MKISSILLLLAVLLAAACGLLAQDTQSINVGIVMKVDPLGDGVMTMTFTLSAIQFKNWQSKYGEDQGLLRRDMTNNYMGQFDTSDWDVKTDTMNRTVAISVKAHGIVIPRGGGMFEFRVPKSWRGGERNGTTYSYNFAEPSGDGGIVQTNAKLILPVTASHFTEDKSETGEPVIQYRVPVGSLSGIMLYAGAAFLAAGLLAIVIAVALVKPPRPVHA